MTLHRYTQYGFNGSYWDKKEAKMQRPDDTMWDDPEEGQDLYRDYQDPEGKDPDHICPDDVCTGEVHWYCGACFLETGQ